eukprot:6210082-Pleurochrysis_carterae.AAC.1
MNDGVDIFITKHVLLWPISSRVSRTLITKQTAAEADGGVPEKASSQNCQDLELDLLRDGSRKACQSK